MLAVLGLVILAALILGTRSSPDLAVASSVTTTTELAPPETAVDEAVDSDPVVRETVAPTTTTTTTSTTTPLPTIPPPLVLSEADRNDRRLETIDYLAAPVDSTFVSAITSPAPDEIILRSTWRDECPVEPNDLSYAQVSFFGFDGEFHTGELLVHVDYVEPMVNIFERLHELRFPIEEMRVVSQAELESAPTEDTNNTTIYTCRRTVSGGRWSRHAYGDAVDINPFHNPYVSNSRVIPALATAYVDRERNVPGIITEDITAMFTEIGWGWGGDWNSVKDWMHFSATGD